MYKKYKFFYSLEQKVKTATRSSNEIKYKPVFISFYACLNLIIVHSLQGRKNALESKKKQKYIYNHTHTDIATHAL